VRGRACDSRPRRGQPIRSIRHHRMAHSFAGEQDRALARETVPTCAHRGRGLCAFCTVGAAFSRPCAQLQLRPRRRSRAYVGSGRPRTPKKCPESKCESKSILAHRAGLTLPRNRRSQACDSDATGATSVPRLDLRRQSGHSHQAGLSPYGSVRFGEAVRVCQGCVAGIGFTESDYAGDGSTPTKRPVSTLCPISTALEAPGTLHGPPRSASLPVERS
jgi:hypothetical protein